MVIISARESELKIKQIIQRTHNVKSFRLDVGGCLDFKPGQYLIVTLPNGLKKPLSISSSPTETGFIEFTKKLTDSDFSKVINNLNIGDALKIKYPFGNFTFEGQYKRIAFLSGGIGITPIRSIIKYLVDKKSDTDVVLLYGNRTMKDIAFKDDFDAMQKQFSGLKVVHILSQEQAQGICRCGYIDCQVIKEEISDYAHRVFYLCGPPLMVECMQKILLEELGLFRENIIIENFVGY
jgi:ferredoxin-NADP reductase